ncbi:uracil phosphoribosyltransferase [Bacillus sp. SD-4]|nr:uracil phosphoribosyltransferase [Bacillus sp. SD-4]
MVVELIGFRDVNTGTKEFREHVDEVGMLMAYEVTRDLELQDVDIETPVTKMTAKRLAGKKLAIVPILRAGLGMTDGILSLVPAARVGHIGLYRDPETLKAVEYFAKLPQDITERQIIVVDTMLATGASAIEAITSLKKRGAKNIRFMCLIAAPIGFRTIKTAVGMTLGVIISKLLGLDNYASSAILVVLCIKHTKVHSLQAIISRLVSCFLVLFLGSAIFSLLGQSPIVLGIIVLLFIPLTVVLKVQEGVITSCVILLHVFNAKSIDAHLIVNETLLLLIGLSIAFTMNLMMPSLDKQRLL